MDPDPYIDPDHALFLVSAVYTQNSHDNRHFHFLFSVQVSRCLVSFAQIILHTFFRLYLDESRSDSWSEVEKRLIPLSTEVS